MVKKEQMRTRKLIAINEFCVHHNIEISFVRSLLQTGLIEITTIEETEFIKVDQLRQLERIICLHDELDINMEGIETITHLLQRMNAMQNEIILLRNRLRLYEV
jgi:hypothetical protein